MLPGSLPPFDKACKKNALVAIADYKSPNVCIAVGKCLLNLHQYDDVIGKSGIAVQIIHHFDDYLKLLSKDETQIPKSIEIKDYNNSETPNQETSINKNCEKNIKGQEIVQGKDINSNEIEDENLSETKDKSEISNSKNESTGFENLIETETETETKKEKEKEKDEIEGLAEIADKLTIEETDNFFKKALFQTLYQDKIDIPINASSFMDIHIKKNLPVLSNSNLLVIKKTSWKKSAKFLKAMEKQNFLKLKGKGDDLVITGVSNRDNNEEIRTFIPYRIKKINNNSSSASNAANGKDGNKSQKPGKLILQTLWKPVSKTRGVFQAVGKPFIGYYTNKELREILVEYINKQELFHPNDKRSIVLDDTLSSIINFPKTAKSKAIGRDKIFNELLKGFTEFYRVLKPDQDENEVSPTRGKAPKVSIVAETKIGRKNVTKITNFEKFFIRSDSFAEELRVKCSGSTTIGPCVQNPNLLEVAVQGSHIKLVTELLISKGLDASWITSEDKTKSKKKKQT
ncbi:Tma64p ASCRUDRAFT_73644 [Ascoidea rubescens DSM 1968]|uniref:Uncharacterized protein n=1 Tax=Ascoidea rubescens DSM 1968 TaxID=1344418 RepID=A0A1D2VQM1_9ASCO|nr:hypothetical protein ASCRUDRAFT_73644 [Ascoidea rubescens DSM 1968]ODV63900.1 hypothetical protein ASCRUDRAFT_73644 [Ascoidea rubescens DSM 1968]